MRSAFSGLRFVVTDVADAGDRVWVRLRMQGRHTGPSSSSETAASTTQYRPPAARSASSRSTCSACATTMASRLDHAGLAPDPNEGP
ncbi:hypothetical protein [Streptomyces sp. NPDC059805]|uniref:hypothetical protein n=1 Tax=Streptomyces sp. NPDC059805 TaxID=3346954 RepID=UPI003657B74D